MKQEGEYLGLIGLILLISGIFGQFGVWAGCITLGVLFLLVGFYRIENKRREESASRHSRIWDNIRSGMEEGHEKLH